MKLKVLRTVPHPKLWMKVTLSCLRAAKSASTTAAEGLRPLDNIGIICNVDEDAMFVADPLDLILDWSVCSNTVSSTGDFEEASLLTGEWLSLTAPLHVQIKLFRSYTLASTADCG